MDGSGWGWGCCLGCGLAPQYAGAAAAELRGRSSQAVDKKSFALVRVCGVRWDSFALVRVCGGECLCARA